MGSQNWPVATDAEGYFRTQEKRILRQERRPQVQTASDLLGPGVAAYAVEIPHWNSDDATFNGTFWTQPGDTGGPDTTHWWIGQTEASSDGFGIQQVLTFHDSVLFPPLTYRRQFFDSGNGNISYSNWVSQHRIAVGDAVSSDGTLGMGGWTLNGDGTVTGLDVVQPFMRRQKNASDSVADGDSVVNGWNNAITAGSEWTYNDATGEFTLGSKPGVWLCNAVVILDNTDEDPYTGRLYWQRSGGTVATGPGGVSDPGSDTYLQCIGTINMLVGQTLQLYCNFQGAGGSGTATANGDSLCTFQRISGS